MAGLSVTEVRDSDHVTSWSLGAGEDSWGDYRTKSGRQNVVKKKLSVIQKYDRVKKKCKPLDCKPHEMTKNITSRGLQLNKYRY